MSSAKTKIQPAMPVESPSERISVEPCAFEGVQWIVRRPLGDERGYLERLFCAESLAPVLEGRSISQINRTLTRKKGTVRGMHFQYAPDAEVKVVTCLKGKVFDVVVDVRRDSPTFLQWHGEILTADTPRSLWIPEGFAHGFQALSDDCELLYFHTAPYRKESEGALNALDPALGIEWPIAVTQRSARDEAHPSVGKVFPGGKR